MASRALTDVEKSFATGIFGSSLPLDKINIGDDLGIGGAPWTGRGLTEYTIHMGPAFAAGASSAPYALTFAHELTHVWQGHHSLIPWSYMANSVAHQGLAIVRTGSRNAAYDYVKPPTDTWDNYNVEQQANIVEDWWNMGRPTSGEWYAYITANIRAGKK